MKESAQILLSQKNVCVCFIIHKVTGYLVSLIFC